MNVSFPGGALTDSVHTSVPVELLQPGEDGVKLNVCKDKPVTATVIDWVDGDM